MGSIVGFQPFGVVLLCLFLRGTPPRNNRFCRVAVGGLPDVEHVGIQSELVHVGFFAETGEATWLAEG